MRFSLPLIRARSTTFSIRSPRRACGNPAERIDFRLTVPVPQSNSRESFHEDWIGGSPAFGAAVRGGAKIVPTTAAHRMIRNISLSAQCPCRPCQRKRSSARHNEPIVDVRDPSLGTTPISSDVVCEGEISPLPFPNYPDNPDVVLSRVVQKQDSVKEECGMTLIFPADPVEPAAICAHTRCGEAKYQRQSRCDGEQAAEHSTILPAVRREGERRESL